MGKIIYQCLSCRKATTRGTNLVCPYCKSTEATARKLCKGITHPPGGEMVSLAKFSIHKAGYVEGRPLSQCKVCRNASRRTAAPYEIFGPIIDWIKSEGYTHRAIAKKLNVTETTVGIWANKKTKKMCRRHFIKLMALHGNLKNQKRQQRVTQGQLGGSDKSVPAP